MYNLLFRQGIQRLERKLREEIYFRTAHDITRPILIRIKTSDRCNYLCGFCNHPLVSENDNELSVDEWRDVFVKIKKFSPRATIIFSGGEPFVRQDFLDIVEACAHEKLHWGLMTNGSKLNKKNVTRLVSLAPQNIDISIDGATAKTQDVSRGAPGSFLKIVRGIELLNSEYALQKYRIPIRLKCTVHKLNYEELPQLVDLVHSLGMASVDFSPVRKVVNTDYERYAITDERDIKRLSEVMERIIQLKLDGAPIETSVEKLQAFSMHVEDKPVFHGHVKCRAGMRDFMIEPDGNVRPCWLNPPIGNIKKDTMRNVWHGETATDFRSAALKCSMAGNSVCATSCLSHRTLFQDAKRGFLHLRRANHVEN